MNKNNLSIDQDRTCRGFKLALICTRWPLWEVTVSCMLFFKKKSPSWLIGRSHDHGGLLRRLLQWLQDKSRAEASPRRPALPRQAGRRPASLGARRAPLPRRPAGDGTRRPSIPREEGRCPAGGSAGPPLIIVGERGLLHPPSP
jgi:hypothetical protein